MYNLVHKYGLLVTFGLTALILAISFGIYKSDEFIIDPIDGSLKSTEVYGMLDGEVIEKASLEQFDEKRYNDNPDENANIIGNVAPFVNIGYALFIIGVFAIIGTFIYSGIRDFNSIKPAVIFFAILGVLYIVTKMIAPGVVPEGYKVETTDGAFNLAGGLLNMAYTLSVLAVISIAIQAVLPEQLKNQLLIKLKK